MQSKLDRLNSVYLLGQFEHPHWVVVTVLATAERQNVILKSYLEGLVLVHQRNSLAVQLVIDTQDIWPTTFQILTEGYVAS